MKGSHDHFPQDLRESIEKLTGYVNSLSLDRNPTEPIVDVLHVYRCLDVIQHEVKSYLLSAERSLFKFRTHWECIWHYNQVARKLEEWISMLDWGIALIQVSKDNCLKFNADYKITVH